VCDSSGTTWAVAETSVPSGGVWHHIVGVWDRAGQDVLLYVDGVLADSEPVGWSDININMLNVTIGAAANDDHYWNGLIDEVRLSTAARSECWLNACYLNQLNPEGFYDVSIEESVSADVAWNASLNFTNSFGVKDSVIFGEAPGALDGQDGFDVPKAGFPPQPYLYAWFDAGLSSPFDKLWFDIRDFPDDYEVWNLSVIWAPSDYITPSNVTIMWDSNVVDDSGYNSVLLCNETGVPILNMWDNDSYTFNCSAMIPHNFKIICSSLSQEYITINSMKIIFIIWSTHNLSKTTSNKQHCDCKNTSLFK